MITCDYCGKEKPDNEVTLMQEGVGIKFSKKSRVIESKIRDWVEFHSGKKIILFPHVCYECQRNEIFRDIMRGK